MNTTTIDRVPREFLQGRRSSLRVLVRGAASEQPAAELDAFVERLRCDVFALYATVREAQRERDLPQAERLRMLAAASDRAARIAGAIDAWSETASRGDEPEFAVPI